MAVSIGKNWSSHHFFSLSFALIPAVSVHLLTIFLLLETLNTHLKTQFRWLGIWRNLPVSVNNRFCRRPTLYSLFGENSRGLILIADSWKPLFALVFKYRAFSCTLNVGSSWGTPLGKCVSMLPQIHLGLQHRNCPQSGWTGLLYLRVECLWARLAQSFGFLFHVRAWGLLRWGLQ